MGGPWPPDGHVKEAFSSAIRDALARDADVAELVQITKQHKDGGLTPAEAYAVLETARTRCVGEPMEDMIMEVMDIVSGYCHPSRAIWPGSFRP